MIWFLNGLLFEQFMTNEKADYRQIIKSTSLFGGVQIVRIIVSIIKNKIIAVLLGPTGMGIAGLFNSSTLLISGLTNLGLGVSAVKDISESNTPDNIYKINSVVSVFRKLVWLTGLLGTLLTILFSNWISELTFGDNRYRFDFIWLSVTLLFTQLSTGQLVVLQGLRKLNYLAKANVIGALLSLFLSIPVYYFWGVRGIVPALIISSIITLFVSWFYSKKIKFDLVKLSWFETFKQGKGMIKTGFIVSINGLVAVGVSYIFIIFVNRIGGAKDVGLYNAGFAIINTYVGMIFSAMLTDYYPRLSGLIGDINQFNKTIQQQAEIAVLIIAPIICVFLIFIKIGIILLLSSEFIKVTVMINWAILGILLKTASWPISIIFIPKGDSKLFLINELITSLYSLALNVLGYYYLGLEGLGISYIIIYFIYFIQVSKIVKTKYKFVYNKIFFKILAIQSIICCTSFIFSKYIVNQALLYLIGLILIVISLWYSYTELDKRIEIKTMISKILKN